MKIALRIPFYNGSAYFDRAIKSAYQQTIKFDEIVVVNDGSSEPEKKWLINYLSDSKVILLHKENGGQGSARNYGVKIAKSEYICFLDQDDFLSEEHNSILKNRIESMPHPRGWVYGNFNTTNDSGLTVSRKSMPPSSTIPLNNIYQMVDHDLFILPSAVIIVKEAFLNVNGFDTQFKGYEDDDLFIRLFMSGVNFEFVNQATYYWRMHGSQTSGSLKMCQSRINFIKKWMNFDYGIGVNKSIVILGLYNRFKKTIIRDFIAARSIDDIVFLKKICLEFYSIAHVNGGLSYFVYKFMTGIIRLLPQRIIIILARVYQKSIKLKKIIWNS